MERGEVAVASNCRLDSFHPIKTARRFEEHKDRGYYVPHAQTGAHLPSAFHPHHGNRRHGFQPHYPPQPQQQPQHCIPFHQPHQHQNQFRAYSNGQGSFVNGRRFPRYHANDGALAPRPAYRDRRPAICTRFVTKGTCTYGSKCKFSHDTTNISSAKDAIKPYNRAASSHEDPEVSTASHTRKSKIHVLSPRKDSNSASYSISPETLQDHFPSLSDHGRAHRISHSKNGARDGDNQACESTTGNQAESSHRLLFKEAVLKQNTVEDNSSKLSSPTKSDVNANNNETDDESTQSSVHHDNSRSPTCTSEVPVYHSYASRSYNHFHSNGNNHNSKHMMWVGDEYRYPQKRNNLAREENDRNPQHALTSRSRSLPVETFAGFDYRYREFSRQPFPEQSPELVYPIRAAYGQIDASDFAICREISRSAEEFLDCLDVRQCEVEVLHQQAITELQATVGRLWSDTTVDIFGSNYTRLALPISDVDCVLVSKTFSSETPQTVLRTVAAAVKSEHWASRVELLESAKIPVLKIVFADDNQHQVMLDVTCGHSTGHSGLSARDVIYSYQAQMPALRPLVLLLKAHAQSQGLNCSYTGGMSSYALVLLAIRFLQACGDEHHKTFEICRASSGGGWKRRFSADDASLQACERPSISSEAPARRPQWIYTFSREGNVIWRTGIGNLLLLFLETYITFDYRRFGISVKNGGEYFPLPIDRVVFEPGCVVTPFITDPIKPGRSIGNCFRMHEVVQSWFQLYQQLSNGITFEDAIASPRTP